jgi:hypothetical protein
MSIIDFVASFITFNRLLNKYVPSVSFKASYNYHSCLNLKKYIFELDCHVVTVLSIMMSYWFLF